MSKEPRSYNPFIVSPVRYSSLLYASLMSPPRQSTSGGFPPSVRRRLTCFVIYPSLCFIFGSLEKFIYSVGVYQIDVKKANWSNKFLTWITQTIRGTRFIDGTAAVVISVRFSLCICILGSLVCGSGSYGGAFTAQGFSLFELQVRNILLNNICAVLIEKECR